MHISSTIIYHSSPLPPLCHIYLSILKWGVSVVFITNALRYTPSIRVVPLAYGAGDDCKRVVFLSSQLKQERERKIERLGKRQALYMRLYFPRGFRSRKRLRGHLRSAGDCRCASSSLGLFLRSVPGLPRSVRVLIMRRRQTFENWA